MHLLKSLASQRGASSAELIVVLPVITLLGLGALQMGLVMQQKNALHYALQEAARAGSVGNATKQSIEEGLVRGLMPVMVGAKSATEIPGALIETKARIVQAKLLGWLEWKQLSPNQQAFADFGVKNKDGQLEIPNDNLALRPRAAGDKSGQSILDANVLKLEMTYGVPLQVPVIGRVYSTLMTFFITDPKALLMLKQQRLPVNLSFATRMQSPAIEGGHAVNHKQSGGHNPSLGLGKLDEFGDAHTPKPPEPIDPPEPGEGDPPATGGGGDSSTPPTDPKDDDGGQSCPGEGQTITDHLEADVMFSFDSSTLTEQGKQALDQLIEANKDAQFESLMLAGHTDQLGNEDYNARLSLNRANAVRDYLQNHGFGKKPINTVGLGSSQPLKVLSACPSGGQAQKDCLAPNRRVDVTFVKLRR